MTTQANNLSAILPQIDPGITTSDAYELGVLADNQNLLIQETVGGTDQADAYAFSVSAAGEYNFSLSNLTADADLFIYDENRYQIGASEIGSNSNEFLQLDLAQGDYYAVVESFDNQLTNYNLETNIINNQEFNIEITQGEGFDFFSPEMVVGLEAAADFWENIVTHSSFAGDHTLTIEVGGTPQGANTLASAGPRFGATDSNENWLPTSGISNINTNPDVIETFNSNIEYFTETMIHEFGHVMGLGTLWERNDLIDFETATYSADTYAGIAYGELLGTNEATAIPLTNGQGSGSDFGHWSESVFDNEIMSPTAEAIGVSELLSHMTIASLRDLGWNVDYDAAQAYALSDEVILALGSSSEVASTSDSGCGCGFCASCGGGNILSQNLMDAIGVDSSSDLF